MRPGRPAGGPARARTGARSAAAAAPGRAGAGPPPPGAATRQAATRETTRFVGIAVAQDARDIAVRPTGEGGTVVDDGAGPAARAPRPTARRPAPIGREETGGVATLAALARGAAGRPVAVVTPRQARDCARATGRLAAPDRRDAQALAHLAEALRPPARPLPDEAARDLAALVARRRQGPTRREAQRTRRRPTPPAVRPPVDAVSAVLAHQAKARDRALARALATSPRWPAPARRRLSGPGVGPVLTATPPAGRPGLGRLDRTRIAAPVRGRRAPATAAHSAGHAASGAAARRGGRCGPWPPCGRRWSTR